MKAQARNLIPTWAYLSSPDALRMVRVLKSTLVFAVSYSRVVGLELAPSAHEIAASSLIYVDRPGFAFRCYGWMCAPSNKKSLFASISAVLTLKISSGVTSNDQSMRKRCQGMIVMRSAVSIRQASLRSCIQAPRSNRQAHEPLRRWQ